MGIPRPDICPNHAPCCEFGDLCLFKIRKNDPSEHCQDRFPEDCPRIWYDRLQQIMADPNLFPKGIDTQWMILRNECLHLAYKIGQYVQFPISILTFFMNPMQLHITLGEIEAAIDLEPLPLVRGCIQRRYFRWLDREDTGMRRMRVMGHGRDRPFAEFWERFE